MTTPREAAAHDFKVGDRVFHAPRNRDWPNKGHGTVDATWTRLIRVAWDSGKVIVQGHLTVGLLARAKPALRFKAGDRVRTNYPGAGNRTGVVVQDTGMLSTKALVKYDDFSFTQWDDVILLHKLPRREELFAAAQAEANRSGLNEMANKMATSGGERPDRLLHRKWETSYTKRVGDALLGVRRFVQMFKGEDKPIIDALELLRGYHRDLHIPYQERDQACAEAARLNEVCTEFRRELSEQDNEIARLRELIAGAQRALEHKA